MAAQNFKIVPAETKPIEQQITDLREYLAANVGVHTTDMNFEKAAIFQQHLDCFELLVEKSRDRV